MKTKFYVTLLIGIFWVTNSFSQVKFKVGANLGGQISNLRGVESREGNNFSLVPMFGFNLEVEVSPSLSIVTGINFERWKKKRELTSFDEFAFPNGTINYKDGYDFYNIPLLIRYKFGNKKDFFIDGGAFVNYFNKGRPDRRFNSLLVQFEDYNFGATLGVGKVFEILDKLDIALQLRNELGLTDINKYEWNISGDAMTNTIRLIVTLSYQL